MKKVSLFLVFQCVIILSGFSQNQNTDLLNQREQVYQHYKSFRDTMTIRTWINMVELSKRLEAVVVEDDKILKNLPQNSPVTVSNDPRINQLTQEKEQLIKDNLRLNNENEAFSSKKNTYLFFIVLLVILLIFSSFYWIRNTMKFKQMLTQNTKDDKKILNLKQQHKEETDALKEEIEQLKTDKMIVENSANQIKKSFDVLKSESSMAKNKVSDVDDEALNEVRKEMKELTSEIAKVLVEKQKLEEELLNANEKLKTQEESGKAIEDELENLLKKLKKE